MVEGYAVLPEYMRDNTLCTLRDISLAELTRFSMSLQAVVSILLVELNAIVQEVLHKKVREGDEQSLMQVGRPGAEGDNPDGGDGRPPWRPRKRGRTTRRRALNRRTRNMDMHVTEWATAAGGSHAEAIQRTEDISKRF